MLPSVSRGFSKEHSGLSSTPGPAAAPGIPRATPAKANICTAGSNSVLLNLAPLNSPWLRQGQDEATGSAVSEQPQFVCPPAVSWDSSGMTVQGDKAAKTKESPAAPMALLGPGPPKNQGQEQALAAPSLWHGLRCPLYI